ncbi:hypothetical protein HU200_013241 [Digitaria exilis]|uniref:Gnk2-homologous domain-containing protein n=1 Tax=Digitaria exilis TaxID=1010633 RepID=A0A835FDJ9_9POAL|nr:hypothetical protein HU200_013241 [Digitaria exilis]
MFHNDALSGTYALPADLNLFSWPGGMHHSARRLLLPLVAVAVASLLAATATAAYHGGVTVTHETCSTTKWNYGSPYGNNVGELLSTLSGAGSAAPVDNWWFRTATVGSVSGLAMCFADSDATWCRKCLTFLISKYLPYKCDHSRNASVVTSGGCVVRYADAPFFGSASGVDSDELVVVSSTHPTYDAAAMREARRTLLSQLAETAGEEALRFATGSQGYMVRHGGSQVMYGMAQCTRDLPASECTACLLDLLAVMYKDVSVTNNTEASVMGFSCYLTYQIDDPIYIDGMAPPLSPAPAPLPVPAVTTPTGSSSAAPPPVAKMTTVLIAALAAVTLLVSAIAV